MPKGIIVQFIGGPLDRDDPEKDISYNILQNSSGEILAIPEGENPTIEDLDRMASEAVYIRDVDYPDFFIWTVKDK